MKIEKMDDVRGMRRMQQKETLRENDEFRYGGNAYRWDDAYSKLYIYCAEATAFLHLASLYHNSVDEVLQILRQLRM